MVSGLVRVRQAGVAQGLCPGLWLHSPRSLHNALLGPSAPGGVRRGGECRTATQLGLLQPQTRRLLLLGLLRPGCAWGSVERSCESGSCPGPGVWWLGPVRPKDPHLLPCLFLTPRPAAPDRGLCAARKKERKTKEKKQNKTHTPKNKKIREKETHLQK